MHVKKGGSSKNYYIKKQMPSTSRASECLTREGDSREGEVIMSRRQAWPLTYVSCQSHLWRNDYHMTLYLLPLQRILLLPRCYIEPNKSGRLKYRAFYHLEGGDVATDVDGMPAGVCGVRGRTLGYRHGEKERLLAACVHGLVVHFHSVEQLL